MKLLAVFCVIFVFSSAIGGKNSWVSCNQLQWPILFLGANSKKPQDDEIITVDPPVDPTPEDPSVDDTIVIEDLPIDDAAIPEEYLVTDETIPEDPTTDEPVTDNYYREDYTENPIPKEDLVDPIPKEDLVDAIPEPNLEDPIPVLLILDTPVDEEKDEPVKFRPRNPAYNQRNVPSKQKPCVKPVTISPKKTSKKTTKKALKKTTTKAPKKLSTTCRPRN